MRSTSGSRFVFVAGVLGAVLGILAIPGLSRADVISDEEAVCRDKAQGDRCEVGGTAGACQTSTCSRNDYSDGPPPKQVSVECLLCVPGAASDKDDAEATPTKVEPATAEKPAPEPKKAEAQKGGCAVVSSSTSALGFGFGAVILVGGFATRRSRSGGIDRA